MYQNASTIHLYLILRYKMIISKLFALIVSPILKHNCLILRCTLVISLFYLYALIMCNQYTYLK